MKIEDIVECNNESSLRAEFSVYFPLSKLKLKRFRLIKCKKGGYYIGFPSYSIKTDDNKIVWESYLELMPQEEKELRTEIYAQLKEALNL